MELQTRLHNLQKENMTLDTYIQSIQIIGDELMASGHLIDEHDLIVSLLRGL